MRKNVKKNTGEKRTEKDWEKAEKLWPKGEKPATMEIWVAGFPPKGPFFDPFHITKIPAPVIFWKSDSSGIKSADLHRHLGSTIKSMRSSSYTSKSPTGQSRKYTFYPTNWKIDWTNVSGPLVSINDWSCITIWHQTTCRSISDHREKNFKRCDTARDSSSALATT